MAEVKKQGRRSAENAEKTRRHILNVAKDLFCEFGYSRVSLRNISEKAGISHSLIRHHFGSKEQIWASINDALHQNMISYSKVVLNNLSPELKINERIYQFSVRILAFLLSRPQPIKLMADVIREEGDMFDYFMDKSGLLEKTIIGMVDEYNQRTQSDIELAEIKWQTIMYAHSAASMRPFMQQTWAKQTCSYEECLLLHWSMFSDMLTHKLNVASTAKLQPTRLDQLIYHDDLPCANFSQVND